MIEKLLRWWSSLQIRERRMLGYGGAGVLVVLAYLLAFEPAWVGRQRLQAEFHLRNDGVQKDDRKQARRQHAMLQRHQEEGVVHRLHAANFWQIGRAHV